MDPGVGTWPLTIPDILITSTMDIFIISMEIMWMSMFSRSVQRIQLIARHSMSVEVMTEGTFMAINVDINRSLMGTISTT